MRGAIRLLGVAALASALPQIAQAEHPIGSPAWLREQQAAETAPVAPPQTTPEIQAPVVGDGGQAPDTEAGEGATTSLADTTPGVATINPLSRMALGDLQAFKGRPLFAPSRRAPDVPVPVSAPMLVEAPVVSETPAPDLRLIGIVAGVDKAVAVLGNPSGGPPVSVRVGDAVETWRVDLIAPDRVVLKQGERVQTYRLFASAGAAIRTPSQMRKGEASAAPGPSTAQPELAR